jgi:hypothetical protein
MNLEVIIRDCIDERDEEYHTIAFECVQEGGYLTRKPDALLARICENVGLVFPRIRHISITERFLMSLFQGLCPHSESDVFVVIWSKKEGLKGHIRESRYCRIFFFDNVSYYFRDNEMRMYFGVHNTKITINGSFQTSSVFKNNREYKLSSEYIVVKSLCSKRYALAYDRIPNMNSPLEISCIGMTIKGVGTSLDPRVLHALRGALRRRYKFLDTKKKRYIFNPVIDRSYTREYLDHSYDILRRYVRQFCAIVMRLNKQPS